MPFPMKVQPFDPASTAAPLTAAVDTLPVLALKPLPHKSRLKRLLERQFRAAPPVPAPGDVKDNTEPGANTTAAIVDPEPSSLCLSKMVHNFLEGNNDKPARCGRRRCSCFNGSTDDSSDDDFDPCGDHRPPPTDVSEIVKSLVSCTGAPERNLLAEVCRIVERTRVGSDKDDASRRRTVVADRLTALGFDASICKSRWGKSPTVPDGEYEYVDVVLDGVGETDDRRVLIDIDFRSEFEIARSTKRYRAVLQSLPAVFVGRADRLQHIVAVVSEAARHSLKKRGLHVPPWRKSDYMKAKWLSPYQRLSTAAAPTNLVHTAHAPEEEEGGSDMGHHNTKPDGGAVGNVVGIRNPVGTDGDSLLLTKPSELVGFAPVAPPGKEEERPGGRALAAVRVEVVVEPPAPEWQPPAVTPKARTPRGAKLVTGLTSMILAEKENVDG